MDASQFNYKVYEEEEGEEDEEFTLSSGDAGCHSGGPFSVRRPIASGEALITPTPLLFK